MIKDYLRKVRNRVRSEVLGGVSKEILALRREILDTRKDALMMPLISKMKCVHIDLEKVDNAFNVDAADKYDYSWKLKTKQFPYSCTDEEGMILYSMIVSNHLKSGFEIATAFGFSSMYIGLGLKESGGQHVSMDCYVEEWKESFLYQPEELAADFNLVKENIAQGILPEGLNTARTFAAKLNLSSVIDFEVGISPQDVPAIIGERKLDFAFIDGGHFGEQPLKDFQAIVPYLSEKCAVFFHDNNSDHIARAVSEAERVLGTTSKMFATRHNLTLVGRLLDSYTCTMLENIVARHELKLM